MIVSKIGLVACVLALLPSAGAAQRSMGGGGMGRGGRGSSSVAVQPALEIPQIVNGINLLIEHRQDLALSDSQFIRIIRVKRAVDSTNSPLMRKLDSVQFLFKGGGIRFGSESPAKRDSLAEARAMIAETQVAIRENIAEAHQKAFDLLSYSQSTKAQAIEDTAVRALADDAKAKSNAKGKGGG